MKRRRRPFSNITKLHIHSSTGINSSSSLANIVSKCTPSAPTWHCENQTTVNKIVLQTIGDVNPASNQMVSDNKENVDADYSYINNVYQSPCHHTPEVATSISRVNTGGNSCQSSSYELKLKELGEQLPCSLWCMDLTTTGDTRSVENRAHADHRADQMQLLEHHKQLVATDPLWAATYDKELYRYWRSLERSASSNDGDECNYIERCHIINESRRTSTINMLVSSVVYDNCSITIYHICIFIPQMDLCQQMKVTSACVYLCIDILDRFLALQHTHTNEEKDEEEEVVVEVRKTPFDLIELVNIACAALVVSFLYRILSYDVMLSIGSSNTLTYPPTSFMYGR